MRLVTFESGGHLFALPASEVRSVIPAAPTAGIPGMPMFLVGLITIRGVLVPVVDLQRLLDGEATEVTSASCMVVADAHHAIGEGTGRRETHVALLVPRLGPALLLDEERIDPPPEIGGVVSAPYIADVARVDGGLCFVLDLPVLLAGHCGVLERCVLGVESVEEDRHGGTDCRVAA